MKSEQPEPVLQHRRAVLQPIAQRFDTDHSIAILALSATDTGYRVQPHILRWLASKGYQRCYLIPLITAVVPRSALSDLSPPLLVTESADDLQVRILTECRTVWIAVSDAPSDAIREFAFNRAARVMDESGRSSSFGGLVAVLRGGIADPTVGLEEVLDSDQLVHYPMPSK